MPKIQTEISLSSLHTWYVALYNYLLDILTLNYIYQAFIEVPGINKKNIFFVKNSSVFEDNAGYIVVASNNCLTPISKYISIKYH